MKPLAGVDYTLGHAEMCNVPIRSMSPKAKQSSVSCAIAQDLPLRIFPIAQRAREVGMKPGLFCPPLRPSRR